MSLQLPRLIIITINCRGLRDASKRRVLFHQLRTQQADIVCLQETHCTAGDARHWTNTWAGPAVWTKHAAVLLAPSHSLVSSSVRFQERLILAEVKVRGHTFTVANLYANADAPQRLSLFRSFVDHPSLFDPSSVALWTGDWNCCPSPVDREPPRATSDHWIHLAPSLVDYFDAALQGAKRHYFTFHHTNGQQRARLDHVFCSTHLAPCSFSTDVLETALSSTRSLTDHKLLKVTVSPPTFNRPTIWRLNTSLLIRQDLRALTERAFQDASGHWDAFKVLARSSARDVAVVASHERNREARRLQRQLQQAERSAEARRCPPQTDPTCISARTALRTHLDAAASRAILRARVQWLEEGERCSTYFFSRHRNARSTSRLSLLRDAHGHEFATTDARTAHLRAFYTRLYAAPPHDPAACHSFLSPLTLPQLGPEDVQVLGDPITADELAAVVRKLPLRKSPGPDGLPYEWYRTYLPLLSPALLELFNGILEGNPPPASWSATTLTLLPKPGREPSEIRNWRPITLSNCDAKIFSRILANRLALILPRLLHPDQSGFVRGRSAPDVAMTIKTVLAHAAEHQIDGALAFLDQEKAYDRVAHPYLLAVLERFGFPSSLARVFFNTSGPSHTFILDDGHPLPAVLVACGVRQGDPLAPLLFNLAIEPLLATLRVRLQGVTLQWGFFIVGVYADDLTVGLSRTDVPVLQAILAEYGRASNGLVNFTKSHILDLSGSATTPRWITATGLQVQDPQRPIRVLGYDLILSPSGVQEDWPQLFTSMRATAMALRGRNCALQGRVLLANSLVLSQLWYKTRLSSPSYAQLRDFKTLAWEVVWQGKMGLKPSMPDVGLRPRRYGGVGLIDAALQIPALQATWIARALTVRPRPPWGAALDHFLSTLPEGPTALATGFRDTDIRTISACWEPFVTAWRSLSPQWTFDPADWTQRQVLGLVLPATKSTRFPNGIRIIDVVARNPVTHAVTFLPPERITKYRFGAAKAVTQAVAALQDGRSVYPPPLVQLALSSSPTPLRTSSHRALHAHIQIAGVMLVSLTTSLARRFLEKKAGRHGPFSWKERAITQLGKPPRDIWSRLHHRARVPRHKETYYKFLFNALSLGARVHGFNAGRLFCHHCPLEKQTLRHFIHSCPLAQAVWQEVRLVFSLPWAVSLKNAAFSWSPNALVLGRRFGFRLQAGHAVAVHVLWLLHTRAVYNNQPASIISARATFRAHLHQYLETLWASTPPSSRDRLFEDWSPPIRSASRSFPFNLCI